MKLKFDIIADTRLSATRIMEQAVYCLNESDYYIKNKTKDKLNFTKHGGNPWRIVSTGKMSNMIDSGILHLGNDGNKNTIKLTYYINILGDLIFIGITLVLSIAFDYRVLLFSLIFLIRLILTIKNIKSEARWVVDEIIRKD